MTLVAAVFDFCISGNIAMIDGPSSIIVWSYYAVCCGLSMTYLETCFVIFCLLANNVAKLVILSQTNTNIELACVAYGLPILMNLIILWGMIYPADQLKRLRYLKSLCIETQLAQMKQERQKTDYLLSLSLPKSIVAKLRDQSNFGLIVEKFPDTCVMFGDLKNFKAVAHMISMKEAVIMLNGVFEHIDEVMILFPSLEKIKVFIHIYK
jgi:hypothetical protein